MLSLGSSVSRLGSYKGFRAQPNTSSPSWRQKCQKEVCLCKACLEDSVGTIQGKREPIRESRHTKPPKGERMF